MTEIYNFRGKLYFSPYNFHKKLYFWKKVWQFQKKNVSLHQFFIVLDLKLTKIRVAAATLFL